MKKKLLLLFVLVAYLPSLLAKELLEIKITSGIRSEQSKVVTPNWITVINRKDIVASGATTIADVLRGHTGLQVTDLRGDGASTTISVRGFTQTANANVLVLVDGRRLNHSDTRNPDIGHISLNDIERIEVGQGSSGVLYGNQAVGGIINVITRKPASKRIDVSMGGGSYGRKFSRFNASNQYNNGFAYRFSAETRKSNGYRDHSSRDFRNLSGLLSYQYGSGELFAELQQVEDDLELPGALMQAAYDTNPRQINTGFINDFSNSDIHVFRLSVDQKLNNNWKFKGEVTKRDTNEKLTQSFQDNPSPAGGKTRRDHISLNPRLIGFFQTSRGKAQVTVGLDAENTDFDLFLPFTGFSGPGAVDRSNQQQTRAFYTQSVVPLSEQLSLTLGGRQASVDNHMMDITRFPTGLGIDDSVFVRMIGLNYQPGSSWRFYTRLDENFRFAKVDEMAGSAAATILKTQEGLSFDVGMEWSRQDNSFSLGLYRLELENEIYFDPTSGSFGANINLDDTLRYGILVSGGLTLTDKINVTANYTYTHAKFKAGGLDGQYISGVAPHMATLRVNIRPAERWDWQAELQLVSNKYAQGDNLNIREKAPGYGVLNLSTYYRAKQWELVLKVNNVANKQFAEFIADGFTRSYQPSPERNILMTANYRFY